MDYIGEHPLGMCFYNKDKNHAYFNIPKNASMTLRGLFLHNSYVESNINEIPSFSKLTVVLRDPYKRFISAVNMYLGKRDTNYILKDKTLSRYVDLSDNYLKTNDEHFLEQVFFIKQITSFEDIDYFYCKKSVAFDIANYYNLTLNKSLNQNQSLNIVTQVDRNLIKNVYKHDYELIDNLKFLN